MTVMFGSINSFPTNLYNASDKNAEVYPQSKGGTLLGDVLKRSSLGWPENRVVLRGAK